MEYLKPIFGEQALTYEQFAEKMNAQKEIKLANLTEGQYVGLDKFKVAETQANALQEQLAEANKTIKGLKDLDPEKLAQEVKGWDEKYKKDTTALQAQLERQKVDSMIDFSLLSSKARNVKAARALLDLDKIKLDGEKLTGLEEQLGAIRKDSPYLFGEEEGNPVPGNGSTTQTDDIAKWRAEAGLPPIMKGE